MDICFKFPRSGMTRSYSRRMFNFLRNCWSFSKELVSFYAPACRVWAFQFHHIQTTASWYLFTWLVFWKAYKFDKFNLPVFSFIDLSFVIFKKSLPNPQLERFIPLFSSEFYSFNSYIYVCDPFESNFCIWCEVWIEVHLFIWGYPVVPAFFCWRGYSFSTALTLHLCWKSV